jgi:predicted RecB family nuclease
LSKPKVWDPTLEALAERGAMHERGYVNHLTAAGVVATSIDGVGIDATAVAATREALGRGDSIIVQAALQSGVWSGRADVLRRVEKPSRLGAWSYQVTDAKLSRETKGNTILQISLYSDLLSEMQGCEPDSAFVVTPGTEFTPEEHRVASYAAYYRHVRASLEKAVSGQDTVVAYPEPIEHCEICRWRMRCDEKRRADDHMSLVAGISKSQIGELERRGVHTTTGLAGVPVPLQWRPERGAAKSFEKIREQARIQIEGIKSYRTAMIKQSISSLMISGKTAALGVKPIARPQTSKPSSKACSVASTATRSESSPSTPPNAPKMFPKTSRMSCVIVAICRCVTFRCRYRISPTVMKAVIATSNCRCRCA